MAARPSCETCVAPIPHIHCRLNELDNTFGSHNWLKPVSNAESFNCTVVRNLRIVHHCHGELHCMKSMAKGTPMSLRRSIPSRECTLSLKEKCTASESSASLWAMIDCVHWHQLCWTQGHACVRNAKHAWRSSEIDCKKATYSQLPQRRECSALRRCFPSFQGRERKITRFGGKNPSCHRPASCGMPLLWYRKMYYTHTLLHSLPMPINTTNYLENHRDSEYHHILLNLRVV
jgi:hypothetical protein